MPYVQQQEGGLRGNMVEFGSTKGSTFLLASNFW